MAISRATVSRTPVEHADGRVVEARRIRAFERLYRCLVGIHRPSIPQGSFVVCNRYRPVIVSANLVHERKKQDEKRGEAHESSAGQRESNEKRCTYTALSEAAGALEAQGVDTEIAWIGRDPVRGCLGCGGCSKRGDNRCIFDDDVANGLIEKAVEADGLVVGTPVFYAGANGALLAVLDRLFYAASARLRFKPAAAVASARRAGTTPAIDQINKYFQINCMPVVSSNYWPMVHGRSVEDVRQDAEGLQIMRVLGTNMAWMLQATSAVPAPNVEQKIMTSFIR